MKKMRIFQYNPPPPFSLFSLVPGLKMKQEESTDQQSEQDQPFISIIN